MHHVIKRIADKPILLRIGLLMAAVVLLGVFSMLSSVFIAQTTEGLASAVNQSGTVRMQSYRIGMAVADLAVPGPERTRRVAALARELETRLESPRLADAIPLRASHEVRAAYRRVWDSWRGRMRPALDSYLGQDPGGASTSAAAALVTDYLVLVDEFVAEVDALVGLLEGVAEGRIAMLRQIQAVSLVLTLFVVLGTLVLVARRVIQPLEELLTCADRARRGDFSGRTRCDGSDELGRLGAALNRMSEDLSRLYAGLEERVEEKTRDLARINRSLDLLYRVGTQLNESPISEPLLVRVLRDIRDQLGLGPVTLCLQDDSGHGGGRSTLTARTQAEQERTCTASRCLACRESASQQGLPLPDGTNRQVLALPVEDRGERLGVLIVDLRDGETLEPWQVRLLGTLGGHLGTAIKLQLRQREGRRLALHEERGILARELHDSLAQSLSYLKIQAARLSATLDAGDTSSARAVLAELREGVSSAYRELRELLTTFRLKMDDRGLASALESTVQEYRERGSVEIALDNRLPATLLSPNEEIHVLQIVREALSNVIRHAQARRAGVSLARVKESVEVDIWDDGRGVVLSEDRRRHYGLTIMGERAQTLGGSLTVEPGPKGGTLVRLAFRHRASLEAEPVGATAGPPTLPAPMAQAV